MKNRQLARERGIAPENEPMGHGQWLQRAMNEAGSARRPDFELAILVKSVVGVLIYVASAVRFPIRTRLKAAVAISAQSWLRLTPR